ncbi:MAG: hypothetical protein EA365_12495 [Gloeocapsa sp. DLM2.Bin57]|nr:MAG: hypothetical protein EA365_12495 [Gloeocapsa sp. DLM2.Bin57]
MLTTTGIGLIYGSYLVEHKLSPLVAEELTTLLDRRVEIGEVEGFSPFGGITFSESFLPSTPSEADYIIIERIKVNFNPWTLLIKQKLNLRVNLIQPTIYLQQKEDNSWLFTDLISQSPQHSQGIEINLQSVSLTNANIAIALSNDQGTLETLVNFAQLRWFNQSELLELNVRGELTQGGSFRIAGTMDIPTEELNLIVKGTQLKATQLNHLPLLPLTLFDGTIDSNLEIKLTKTELPEVRGIAKLENLEVNIVNLPNQLTQTSGELRFLGDHIEVDTRSQLGLIPLETKGTIDLQQGLNLQTKTLPIPITEVIESLNLPSLPIDIEGEIKANIIITGALKQPQLVIDFANHESVLIAENEFQSISGIVNLSNTGLVIEQFEALPSLGGIATATGYLDLSNTDGDFNFNLSSSQVPIVVNQIPLEIITAETTIFGSLNHLSQIQGEVKGELSLKEGIIRVDSLTFTGLNWQTNLTIANLNLDSHYLNSQLSISGEDLDLSKINATGEVSLTSVYGLIKTNNFELNNGNWSSEIKAEDLDLFLALNGQIGNSLDDFTAQGYGNLDLANQGNIVIDSLNISAGKITTQVLTNNLDLSYFSLPGYVTANTEISADLTNLSLAGIEARGNLYFNQGLGLINYPIATTIYWDGKLLNLETITGEGINGKGWVAINENGNIEDIDLDIFNARINLGGLVTELSLDGELFFQGKINKHNHSLRVNGDLALQGLTFSGLNFEPLQGKISSDSEINLDLKGEEDLIQLSLTNDYQPNYFWLRQGETEVKGDRQDHNLLVKITNLPLEISQVLSFTNISGRLSGNGIIDLNNYSLVSNLRIDAAKIENLQIQNITTNLTYHNQNVQISNLKLLQGDTEYLGDLELNFTEDIPHIQGEVIINEGDIQDILETWQLFDLRDLLLGIQPIVYGDATSLAGESRQLSLGSSDDTILQQLALISQLTFLAKTNQENQQQTIEIPDLRQLRGNLNGKLILNGYLDSRIKADFNFEGKNWQWDNYTLDKFLITGNFSQETLSFQEISLNSGDSFLNFRGYFNNLSQEGELNLVNIPLGLVNELISLPFNLTFSGKLHGTFSLKGSRENPQAQGNFTLEEIILNKTPVYATTGNFNYKNANLDFNFTSLLTNKAKPIKLEGNFPYQLPLTKISPTSQEFNLSINIADEGLRLINIITTDALIWQQGQGEINLEISGLFNQKNRELSNLTTVGRVKLDQGVIVSEFFPNDPVSAIRGEILFSFDHMEIPYLKGNFSGGDFFVSGNLPLNRVNNGNEFVDINFNNLNLNLKGFYQGRVAGNLRVLGSWLDMDLTGELNLSEGEVFLEEIASPRLLLTNEYINRVDLVGLQLHLRENIKLVRPPILSFVATGSLNLNGSLTNPLPEGTIELKQGGVNLLTTYLRLAKNSQSRARFLPNQGLDPYLEVELVGSVTESNANDLIRDPLSSEISDASVYNLGTVETIRIQANIQGFASQLNNSLQLTSSPPRSQQEILALLGGGVVDSFGSGDTTIGLANLVGGAIFSTVQQELANSFGISELRVFPTPILESENKTDDFGLAAEIGFDATKNFSFSILKVLTDTQPPQFGVRYRFGDRFLLRGSSDFSEDTRGVLEYQMRF